MIMPWTMWTKRTWIILMDEVFLICGECACVGEWVDVEECEGAIKSKKKF